MSFPNTQGKHSYDAFFSPNDFLDYLKENDMMPEFPVPDGVIFTYSGSLLEHIVKTEDVEEVESFAGEFYLLKSTGSTIGVSGKFGIGPSTVVTILEELIALGTKRFISIGTAGALQKSLNIGDFVVCDKAIRDEGVSHHYVESEKYAHPSTKLTARLKENMTGAGLEYTEGATWTIDAPYRETVEELKQYQQEGVLTVEMEASALASVATYRGVDFAAAFTVSDSLADLVWNPQLKSAEARAGLEKLYPVAKETLIGE